MEIEHKAHKRQLQGGYYRIPQFISQTVERFFYNLGLQIAKQPYRWIACSLIVIFMCLGGIFRFRQEKDPLKLWVPPESDFIRDTEWLMTTFKEGQKIETMIFTADDILQPQALVQLNEITKRVFNAQSNDVDKITWTDVCFKVPIISGIVGPQRSKRQLENFFEEDPMMPNKTGYDPVAHLPTNLYCRVFESLPRGCILFSVMDIWEFNSTLIGLQSKEDIVQKMNSVNISPTLGHPMNFSELLGGVSRDEYGRIYSAKFVKTQWIVHINFTNVNMNEMDNDAGTADWTTKDVYAWEASFLSELRDASENLRNYETDEGYAIYYEAGRSFGDISQESIFHDVEKIVIGVFMMSIYVQVILSRFNWVEWRCWLTGVALMGIGGAFAIAIGLCSLAGVPYGPIHTSLPFMLMGLGVDDTFVMMAAWEEVNSVKGNQKRPLNERVALALSHAGAAITVTSFTDVVAFVIGASTILPSLYSFCIYAAVGVLVTYFLQVTFFVAFFTLDCRRIEAKRNGLVPCVRHPNFELVTGGSHQSISWRIMDWLYTRIVLTPVGKIIVVCVTLAFASFGILGASQLEQWFDPVWFLPKDSHLAQYITAKEQGFPKVGAEGTVFMSQMDFVNEFPKILNLSRTLENAPFVANVKNWPVDFVHFVDANFNKDAENTTLSEADFQLYLSRFVFGRSGGKYRRNFKFNDELHCGEAAPLLTMASIDFTFAKFHSPYEWIPGMDNSKRFVQEAGFPEGSFATVWSDMFATWVTDKVISQEVIRNLILALVCVMGMTSFLVAEPQTCLWILLCVLLTLLDVCGFMYFWGLTIDIVSCIGLELAVGLSVDYAAHVAHAFLNASGDGGFGNDRRSRALKATRHIGSAVLFGAGSTLLALSLLAFSRAYVFRAFFRIFLLVIAFGLWHGLLLLPVVLSSIGPRALANGRPRESLVRLEDEIVQRGIREPAAMPLTLSKH
ncbi:hypothetical protein QAD02_000262 [Eretmocerus hayati]|uniref:Uncharacterized protein n=1 Tax=Eretmocerus hayati TaxID=131215 RepID=A0ACC2NE00_9HYME|nr:hypothetical protein QAD02_000262 [Eretmocerus hayati]